MSAISAIIASEIVSENHAESQWMAERIRPERTVRSDRKTCPNRSTWNHLNTRKNLQTARQSIRSILNLEESPKRELSSPPPTLPHPSPPSSPECCPLATWMNRQRHNNWASIPSKEQGHNHISFWSGSNLDLVRKERGNKAWNKTTAKRGEKMIITIKGGKGWEGGETITNEDWDGEKSVKRKAYKIYFYKKKMKESKKERNKTQSPSKRWNLSMRHPHGRVLKLSPLKLLFRIER